MEEKRAREVRGFLVCNLVFQAFFLAAVLFFPKMYLVLHPVFHPDVTLEEWEWLIAQGAPRYETVVLAVWTLVQYAVLVVDIVLLYRLYLAREKLLPVPAVWRAAIPAAAFLLYLPCFFWIRDGAPHYVLYMDMVPTEMLTLVSLGLLWAGIRAKRTKARGGARQTGGRSPCPPDSP